MSAGHYGGTTTTTTHDGEPKRVLLGYVAAVLVYVTSIVVFRQGIDFLQYGSTDSLSILQFIDIFWINSWLWVFGIFTAVSVVMFPPWLCTCFVSRKVQEPRRPVLWGIAGGFGSSAAWSVLSVLLFGISDGSDNEPAMWLPEWVLPFMIFLTFFGSGVIGGLIYWLIIRRKNIAQK